MKGQNEAMPYSKIIIKLCSLWNFSTTVLQFGNPDMVGRLKEFLKGPSEKLHRPDLDMVYFQRFPIEEERCKAGGMVQNIKI